MKGKEFMRSPMWWKGNAQCCNSSTNPIFITDNTAEDPRADQAQSLAQNEGGQQRRGISSNLAVYS